MLPYLLELRQRALKISLIFMIFFLIFFLYANNLFHLLILPLLTRLPASSTLIATQLASTVLTPIRLAADTAILCTAPFALFQLWQFVAPGLYQHEKHYFRITLFSSLLLFSLGILFCFHLVLPFMFQFFVNATPSGVKLMPDMAYAIDFTTQMLLLFGLCFQIPLVCFLLVQMQWVELKLLKKIRPYVIVAAFTLGMLLTPPDVLSQIMLAGPLCLLYETGLILAGVAAKIKKREITRLPKGL